MNKNIKKGLYRISTAIYCILVFFIIAFYAIPTIHGNLRIYSKLNNGYILVENINNSLDYTQITEFRSKYMDWINGCTLLDFKKLVSSIYPDYTFKNSSFLWQQNIKFYDPVKKETLEMDINNINTFIKFWNFRLVDSNIISIRIGEVIFYTSLSLIICFIVTRLPFFIVIWIIGGFVGDR